MADVIIKVMSLLFEIAPLSAVTATTIAIGRPPAQKVPRIQGVIQGGGGLWSGPSPLFCFCFCLAGGGGGVKCYKKKGQQCRSSGFNMRTGGS